MERPGARKQRPRAGSRRAGSDRVEALHRAALALTQPAPLREVLQRILEQACALARAPHGAVGLYDPERNRVVVEAVTDALRPWLPREFPPGAGLLGRAWQLGGPVVVEDYDAWEGRLAAIPQGVTGVAAALPLRYSGRVVGALGVGYRPGRGRPDPARLQLLEYFADLAAVAVESARHRELAQRRARELELLHRLHLPLDAQRTEDALLEAAVEAVHEILGYDRVAVFLLEGEELVLRAHSVPPEERPVVRMPVGRGVNGRAVRTGAPQLVPDVTADPDFLGSVQGVQSLLALPLVNGGRVVGTLSAETLFPRRLSGEDAHFLQEVSHVLSHALAEVRLQEAVRIRARQHAALAALGRLALEADLDTLLQSATELVAQALSVELCKVLQVLPDGGAAVLRAGVGWRDGLVGAATVPLGEASQAGYTLLRGGPVVVDDLRHETRFSGPALLHEHGVRSGVSVAIPGRGSPWGVLGAHTRERRRFSEDDVHFVQAAAALLGAAVRREEDERSLRRRAAELEAVAELGLRLRGAADPEEVRGVLVQWAASVTGSAHAALLVGGPCGEGWAVARAVGAFRKLEGQRLADFAALSLAGTGPRAEAELASGGARVGWLVVARRPEEPPYDEAALRVLRAVAELGATALSRAAAFAELEQAYVDAVLALARTVDARDAYTADHSERMARWAEAVAHRLGCPPGEVQEIRWAALLHDIGKLGVPDAVLRKPGPLTEEEWETMRRHPVLGEEILRPVRRLAGVGRLVRHHQERWDGTGYPDGLRGEQIPLGARILAVVDAYTAMTDRRPYRPPLSPEEAVAELRRCAGTQFDPAVVEAFLWVLAEAPEPEAHSAAGAG